MTDMRPVTFDSVMRCSSRAEVTLCTRYPIIQVLSLIHVYTSPHSAVAAMRVYDSFLPASCSSFAHLPSICVVHNLLY